MRSPRSTKPRVAGTCRICGRHTSNALVVRGKPFVDGDGARRVAADSTYHRECYRMFNKGLLSAGYDRKPKDSTGRRCGGCNTVIEPGDKHAHRSGVPYHRECLS